MWVQTEIVRLRILLHRLVWDMGVASKTQELECGAIAVGSARLYILVEGAEGPSVMSNHPTIATGVGMMRKLGTSALLASETQSLGTCGGPGR